MSDIRKSIKCTYCEAEFVIKYSDDLTEPEYCCFCSESYEDQRDLDEEDEDDLDYTDDEDTY